MRLKRVLGDLRGVKRPDGISLDEFVEWFFKHVPPFGAVPMTSAVGSPDGRALSVVWYRDEEFQVQLFCVPGDTVIPEHVHPNVDSYDVYVGGQVVFSRSGKWAYRGNHFKREKLFGSAPLRGTITRILPNETHGAIVGPAGAVFLSIQRWINGVKPHCISHDYNGPVATKEHLDAVVCGTATYKPAATFRDAASLETEPVNFQ